LKDFFQKKKFFKPPKKVFFASYIYAYFFLKYFKKMKMKKLIIPILLLNAILLRAQDPIPPPPKINCTDGWQPDTVVLVTPEVPAQFVGGEVALRKYLRDSMRYPAVALENEIQGLVFVSFVVEKDGTPCDVRFLKGHDVFKWEANRLVKAMPRWIPATFQGVPVSCKMTIPILFRIPN
jgi:TonB family protein